MRYLLFHTLSFVISLQLSAQPANDSISVKDAKEILEYLAADRLKGRVNFSEQQLEAAEFIGGKLNEFGLQPFPGYPSFHIPFSPFAKAEKLQERVLWNGKRIADSAYVYFSASLHRRNMKMEDFEVVELKPPLGDSLLFAYWSAASNTILWIPSAPQGDLSAITRDLRLPGGRPKSDILLAAAKERPVKLRVTGTEKLNNSILYNVVGVLPGTVKPNEAIIFSAHYDHVDRTVDGVRGGIFNGANDNASGTTAVLMLAKYFSMRKDNARTLVFCLFAGEELGMLGSKAFVSMISTDSIKAVINIEMIGVPTVGQRTFFVTGADRSDLFQIMKEGLESRSVSVIKDPVPGKKLFERSDNYPFALKGIPAHSIMASDDSFECYHDTCDDADLVDYTNMTEIVEAIAAGCESLVRGERTPRRIK